MINIFNLKAPTMMMNHSWLQSLTWVPTIQCSVRNFQYEVVFENSSIKIEATPHEQIEVTPHEFLQLLSVRGDKLNIGVLTRRYAWLSVRGRKFHRQRKANFPQEFCVTKSCCQGLKFAFCSRIYDFATCKTFLTISKIVSVGVFLLIQCNSIKRKKKFDAFEKLAPFEKMNYLSIPGDKPKSSISVCNFL